MISHSIRSVISSRLAKKDLHFHTIGGGCINQCYRIDSSKESYFLKVNSATKFPQLFESERKGLKLLSLSGMKTPGIIDLFTIEDLQLLIMEWINVASENDQFPLSLGEQLASLHSHSSERFGLSYDNYMGSVVQLNEEMLTWSEFFWENRIVPMIRLCTANGQLPINFIHKLESLRNKINQIFNPEPPSLLHGDLWKGNLMVNSESEPVFIDPAVYYGHRSVDLAMTTLFGGFSHRFYDAYNYHFSLPGNFEEQFKVSNLYPLLIHLHLFGKSYLSQIESTVNEFI